MGVLCEWYVVPSRRALSEANPSPLSARWEYGETFLEQPHIVMRVHDAHLTSVERIVTTASILP
jgi:hypothetical protein